MVHHAGTRGAWQAKPSATYKVESKAQSQYLRLSLALLDATNANAMVKPYKASR